MTTIETFAIVASGLIVYGISQMRTDDDMGRSTDKYDWLSGTIVLALAWFAAVGLSVIL